MKLSRTKAALFGNLQTVKMRRRHGLFTAEGHKAVADLAAHFSVVAVVTTNPSSVATAVADFGAEIYEATPQEMHRLSSFTTPSDILGVFRIPGKHEHTIDESKLYVMLDGVRDPGNLGTIIRTCHWFGIYDILASHDCVDCFNPKTVQATMGSLGAVRVHYCDLPSVISRHPSMPVYGTLLEGDNIFETKLGGNGFIVMGNEGEGISAQMRSLITRALNIPPAGASHGESLNVAVATAIVLALFVK